MQSLSLTLFELVRARSRTRELILLSAANLLLIASAYVRIDLPFSPVPVTGQTLGILLVAMALGRLRATGVVAAYLLEGAVGLPVFAGGTAGIQVFFGPTGGYLLAFLPAAFVIGMLADHGWDRSYMRSVVAMTIGTAVIFAGGMAWLSVWMPSEGLLAAGLIPFLPGAAVKIAVASVILPSVWRVIGRGDAIR